MLYTIIPIEVVLNETEEDKIPSADMKIMLSGNKKIQVRKNSLGKYVVDRLLSSDPKDYLNPVFLPGEELS
ncbi:MAG: YlzJ-like family protein [Clostridiales bacterium]|jgi:hypothetical protein|nr:YlzJ-like family protein [Clostridiales bacterium]